jgi:hypothetical protein
MSRKFRTRFLASVLVAGVLWVRVAPVEGGIKAILEYSLAGSLTGLSLAWIARTFASLSFTGRTARRSAGLGFLILTPLIAMLLADNGYKADSSVVVLAVAAAATAAMWGAIWGIMHLARDAFVEWRRGEGEAIQRLTLGEAYL